MRLYCDRCGYPKNTCICDYINEINVSLNITVIQHDKEAQHAKNTVKLLTLCIPDTRIVLANNSYDMTTLSKQCNDKHCALIYPSEASKAIENITDSTANEIKTLILIDGSWKQAFGIIKKNPWLENLPAFHFSDAPVSNYLIRHTSVDNALSTLEATAYAISCLKKTDVSALYKAQTALQQNWRGPLAHRRKLP